CDLIHARLWRIVERAGHASKGLEVDRIGERAESAEGEARNAAQANPMIRAKIAHNHGRRGEAHAAEQDGVGVIFEDAAAAVEKIHVPLQRFQVARIYRARWVVDRMTVASLSRRPFEPYILAWPQGRIRLQRVVIGEIANGQARRRPFGPKRVGDRVDYRHVLKLRRQRRALRASAPSAASEVRAP